MKKWLRIVRDKYPELESCKVIVNDLYGKFIRSYLRVELPSKGFRVILEIKDDLSVVIRIRMNQGDTLVYATNVEDFDEPLFDSLMNLCINGCTFEEVKAKIEERR